MYVCMYVLATNQRWLTVKDISPTCCDPDCISYAISQQVLKSDFNTAANFLVPSDNVKCSQSDN